MSSSVTPISPVDFAPQPPDSDLISELERNPAYAAYQRLLDLEARVLLAIADALEAPVLAPRLQAHTSFRSIMKFCAWLDAGRGAVPRLGAETLPNEAGVAAKLVDIENGALGFAQLASILARGTEAEHGRVMQRVQHLRAVIWIARRAAKPGSPYAVALDAAAQRSPQRSVEA